MRPRVRGAVPSSKVEAMEGLSEAARARLVRASMPDWVSPMLAVLTDQPFSDPRWIFERKLDGERCLAFRKGRQVRLMSRNRLVVSDQYPELVAALGRKGPSEFIVDGEIVAFEGNLTSFPLLQRRMHVRNPSKALLQAAPVAFCLFDVLRVDGYDVTQLALLDRKAILRWLLEFRRPLRYTNHRRTAGEELYRRACASGWEGVIAKRSDSVYEHRRSTAWLKFKCIGEQEFVIGGYTDPKGSRTGFGALLLGYHEGGALKYAGKVGTGFDQAMLQRLSRRLAALRQDRPPFDAGPLPRKGVHWVKPSLVAEVAFSEWTDDGQLRHPRFLGLRDDKAPSDVVREYPRSSGR